MLNAYFNKKCEQPNIIAVANVLLEFIVFLDSPFVGNSFDRLIKISLK